MKLLYQITNALNIGKQPTLLHITHWKAGSQWIEKILRKCSPKKLVHPEIDMSHFLKKPVLSGKIYPTLYITYQQFKTAKLPKQFKKLVIFRDLRDTLISSYFSMKISHPILNQDHVNLRNLLTNCSQEEGLIFLINHGLPDSANIQHSWLEAGESFIRYEDLLENDLEILTPIIAGTLRLNQNRFQDIILSTRFEAITHGRKRGDEDIVIHERKGIAGDWKNYFNNRIKNEFKAKYGELLIRTGYEKDLAW